MARPPKNRKVASRPDVDYFKPRGTPLIELEEVRLTVDEREALRLADLLDLSYEQAGEKMGVSRATFGRIVHRARKILTDAIINGKAIQISGGNYEFTRRECVFRCRGCGIKWHGRKDGRRPKGCPNCGRLNFECACDHGCCSRKHPLAPNISDGK